MNNQPQSTKHKTSQLQTQHEFDEDGCCIHCNFDGAEWHHWKHNTYEGRASEEVKQPRCNRQWSAYRSAM